MKKIALEASVFKVLHDEVVRKFKADNPGYAEPEYQLYGYNQEKAAVNSIRKAILNKYEVEGKKLPKELENYNGKYLRDALKVKLAKSGQTFIEVRASYLYSYLFYLETNLAEFVEKAASKNQISREDLVAQRRLMQLPNQPQSSHNQGPNAAFRCYYYSKINRAVNWFTLRIEGQKAFINNAISGKRYEGAIDQYKENKCNQSITLFSEKSENIKVEVHVVLSGQKPIHHRWFSTGYMSMVSDIEYYSGVLIAEHFIARDALRKMEEASPGPETHSYTLSHFWKDLEAKEMQLLSANELNTIFTSHFFSPSDKVLLEQLWESKNQQNSSPAKIARWISNQKLINYNFFLEQKAITVPHTNLSSYFELIAEMKKNRPDFQSNQQLRIALEGKYFMFTTYREHEDSKGIEQMTVELTKEGKFNCESPDKGKFHGIYHIYQQRILQVHLKKVDGPSNYNLVFEIPRDLNQNSRKPIMLWGIGSGLSKDMLPRGDKLLLCRKHSNNLQFMPVYYDLQNQKNAPALLDEHYPGFHTFFSLNARDNYLQGSNILFSYLVNLPVPDDMNEVAGDYVYYRMNFDKSALKKYTFSVKQNGVVQLSRHNAQMKGHAFKYGQRVFLFFHGNSGYGIDGFLIMNTLHDAREFTQGMLTSFSQADEPFSDLLVIQRVRQQESDKPRYQTINLNADASPQVRGYLKDKGFQIALKLLKSKPTTIFQTQKGASFLRDPFTTQSREELDRQLLNRLSGELVIRFLTEDHEAFALTIKQAKTKLSLDIDQLALHLFDRYRKLTPDQRKEIKNWIEKACERTTQSSGGTPAAII